MRARAVLYAAVLAFAGIASADIEYSVELILLPEGVYGFGPAAINNLGDVVGTAATDNGNRAAVRWADGTFEVLPNPAPPMPPGEEIDFKNHRAKEINDHRQIVGFSEEWGAFKSAWIYQDGQYVYPEAAHPGNYFQAWDINEDGAIVGVCGAVVPVGYIATYWSPQTGPVDILPGLQSIATSISDSGWIAGAWGAGWRTHLGEEPQFFSEISGSYPGINDLGNVIGNGPGTGDPAHHEAFYYSDQTGEVLIANFGEHDFGWTLNNSNVGVGSSTSPSRGWVFSPDRGARLLDDLIDPALGLNITNAWDVNEKGEIVVAGYVIETGDGFRGILRPVGAPCHADLNGNGTLDLFDFLAFTNLFNAQDPAADFDGNGILDLFDFLAFVNAFNAGC
jgi:probable HAF family extracellular repeat protein